MTRTKKSVLTFPESHPDSTSSRIAQQPEEAASYLEYLLDLADRLLDQAREDELQTA